MKTISAPRFAHFALPLLAGVLATVSTAKDTPTAEVMRAKLDHSQRLLRGLAVQDFDGLAADSRRLVELGRAGGWYALQVPEYDLSSSGAQPNGSPRRPARRTLTGRRWPTTR